MGMNGVTLPIATLGTIRPEDLPIATLGTIRPEDSGAA